MWLEGLLGEVLRMQLEFQLGLSTTWIRDRFRALQAKPAKTPFELLSGG